MEVALDTISLSRLINCTLFGTINNHYHYGPVVIALDFGSDGRGFDSRHLRSYFSVPDVFFFFNYNIHDIVSIQCVINRVINLIYIFYNRKSCTNLN